MAIRRTDLLRTLATVFLLLCPMAIAICRISMAAFDVERIAPNPGYRVSLRVFFETPSDTVRVRAHLPQNEPNLILGTRWTDTDLANSDEVYRGGNRRWEWWGETEGRGKVETSFTAIAKNVTYEIAPSFRVPGPLSDPTLPFLESTETIQVDHPAIAALAEELAPRGAPAADALARIYDFCGGLPELGTSEHPGLVVAEDAVGTLEALEGTALGKARLFAALVRHQGFPARMVHGLVMEPGPDRNATSWVEVRLGPSWVPFCIDEDLFARTDGRLVPFCRGDVRLVEANPIHTSKVHFDVARTFGVRGRLIEGSEKAASSWLGVWGALEESGIPLNILCLLLMIPFGAFICVVIRNLLGLRTFGFFLPMLIAIGATHSGLPWALAAFLIVNGWVYLFRFAAEPLRLLHYPKVAVILTSTVGAVLGLAAIGAVFGNVNLAHVTFLPIVVLTFATEQFSTIMEEEGPREVLKVIVMTLIGISLAYFVMSSQSMQRFALTFPESVLILVLFDVLIGSWTGVRLLEYIRFRRLLSPEPAVTHV